MSNIPDYHGILSRVFMKEKLQLEFSHRIYNHKFVKLLTNMALYQLLCKKRRINKKL